MINLFACSYMKTTELPHYKLIQVVEYQHWLQIEKENNKLLHPEVLPDFLCSV